MNQLSIGVFFLRKWGLKCGSTNEATTKRWNLEGAGQDYGGAFIGIASIFSTKCWEGFIRAFGSKAIYIYIYFFSLSLSFFRPFYVAAQKMFASSNFDRFAKTQKKWLLCSPLVQMRNSSPLVILWGTRIPTHTKRACIQVVRP